MENLPGAESKFQVETTLSEFNGFDVCECEAAIDFCSCVHKCGKTKMLAVILTCGSYSTGFDKPPQTSDDDAYIFVEYKHPFELTPGE